MKILIRFFSKCKIEVELNAPTYGFIKAGKSYYKKSDDEDRVYQSYMKKFDQHSIPVVFINSIYESGAAAESFTNDSDSELPLHGVFFSWNGYRDYKRFAKEQLLLAHEILHLLIGHNSKYDAIKNNLLNHTQYVSGPQMGPEISLEQCQLARNYLASLLGR